MWADALTGTERVPQLLSMYLRITCVANLGLVPFDRLFTTAALVPCSTDPCICQGRKPGKRGLE